MLIDVIKFIHLLLTLSLLGSTLFGLILISLKHTHPPTDQLITSLRRITLWLLTFALLTGTLLVYPKHFTFHTPWIEAAYIFVFLFGMLTSLFAFLRKKYPARWLQSIGYLLLLTILLGIVHDAVTKTTLF